MSDLYLPPDPDPPICSRCGGTDLEPIEPPYGKPHHRWRCVADGTVTAGTKAERHAHLTRTMADQAEQMAAKAALARHREETER